MNSLLIVFGMFIITFGIRFGFLAFANRFELPEWVKECVEFIPACVLTAIIVPASIYNSSGQMDLSADNPFLITAIFALGLSLWKEHLLLTIASSMGFYFTYISFIS